MVCRELVSGYGLSDSQGIVLYTEMFQRNSNKQYKLLSPPYKNYSLTSSSIMVFVVWLVGDWMKLANQNSKAQHQYAA